MRISVRVVLGLIMAVSMVLNAVVVAGGRTPGAGLSPARTGVSGTVRLHTPRGRTFISLWPACACGKRTTLDEFSLKTGRRVGTIARVPVATGEAVSPPAARPGGPVLLTFSSGPRCAEPIGGGPSAGPCDPVADSCAGRIESLNPATGMAGTILSVPSSTLVTDAVPSPDGRRLVTDSAGCATSYFDAHLVVRDLASGRKWSIGADAARCHDIGEVSWSADGAQLVFPYGPQFDGRHLHLVAHYAANDAAQVVAAPW